MRLKFQCFEADFVPNTAAGQLRILTGFPRANPKGWRRATATLYFRVLRVSSKVESAETIGALRPSTTESLAARAVGAPKWYRAFR